MDGVLGNLVEKVSLLPCGSWLVEYVRRSYQHDPMRVLLEFLVFVFVINYVFSKRYDPTSMGVALSEIEIDTLIAVWHPDPLVPHVTAEDLEMECVPEIQSAAGAVVTADGKDVINLLGYDAYGLANHPVVKASALAALRTYGVGSCGPPGFYGLSDAHVALAKAVAQFVGSPAAIIYAQGFSAISSVIPAFCKGSDLIVADEGINFALQKGVSISRSKVEYFRHNDSVDLRKKLTECAKIRAYRRFLVVEGIYAQQGDMCPLPEVIEIAREFKYRVFLDDTCAFGVVGRRGAGTCDFYNMDANSVDFLLGQFSSSFAGSGGFCAGSQKVIDHQVLSSSAYVFSASMPPLMAVAARVGIDLLQENAAEWIDILQKNISLFRQHMDLPFVELPSCCTSPQQHVRVDLKGLNYENRETFNECCYYGQGKCLYCCSCRNAKSKSLYNSANTSQNGKEAFFLQRVVEKCREQGVLITRAKYNMEQEKMAPRPSIRVAVSLHGSEAYSVIRKVFLEIANVY